MPDQPSVAVIHLLWHGTPSQHLAAFLASYDSHPTGHPHDLVFLLKGCSPAQAAERRNLIGERPCHILDIPDSDTDIATYFQAAERITHDICCFTNSFAIIDAPHWLNHMVEPLARNSGIGVVGASGSWEMHSPATPFPNPHIRTNGFAIRRDLFLSLEREGVETRAGALEFEAGANSMTRQVRDRKLEACVVDRNGTCWQPGDWPKSRTYRAGEQEGLLVRDNRTDVYANGDARMRRYLETLAWTDRDPGPNPAKRHKVSFKLKTLLAHVTGRRPRRFR